MSSQTLEFLIFAGFSVTCLALGYFGRRSGWVSESVSRPLHTHTVIWLWSAMSLISLWRIEPNAANFWLLIIEPILVVLPAMLMIPIARAIGCSRDHTGVLACAAGLSNTGSTLGAFLCFVLFEPRHEATAYAIAVVSTMSIVGILVMYPLARHFAGGGEGSVWKLIGRTLIDVRSLPLYVSVGAVLLSIFEVPYPRFLEDWPVLQVLFYLAAIGGNLGIGLRLRLGEPFRYLKEHAVLAVVKFGFSPLLAAGMLAAIAMTGRPLPELGQSVFMVESMMPTAVMAVMIANMFHLDARLASVAWLVNTALFLAIPLPLILWWWG